MLHWPKHIIQIIFISITELCNNFENTSDILNLNSTLACRHDLEDLLKFEMSIRLGEKVIYVTLNVVWFLVPDGLV